MTRRRSCWGILGVALLAILGASSASAMTIGSTNFVDLMRDAESIVVGQVESLVDGIDERGVPYTEVTVSIDESMRGLNSETYTFRQFGLLEPRLSADGRQMLAAPSGFPRYAEGEQVVLFLYRPATMTGLQTTVGLSAGKFTLGAARVENELSNDGLFANVTFDESIRMSENDNRMLATGIGAFQSETFLSFLRRASEEGWAHNGLMWKTDEGRPGRGGRRGIDRGAQGGQPSERLSTTPNTTSSDTRRFERN